jgi:hypothetical protein
VTLRAVVEWSWNLLDADAQVLARRLTVFAGGATLEAAERVCGLSDTAGLLSGLVDKSLVEASGGRYRMLETIGAFCAERLAEAGEPERLQHAHATYFLDLAQTADEHLRRAEQVAWLARLTAEHGNLQAALRWAVHADTDLALRLVGALSSYWYLRGLRGEVAPLAAELARVTGPAPPAGLAEEYALCVLHAASGGLSGQELRPHWEAVAAIRGGMERLPRQPFLTVLWALASGPSEPDLAARNHQLERWAGADRWSRALAHLSSGHLRLFSSEVVQAEAAFGLALEGFRAVGDRWGTAQALDALATLAGWRADQAASLALTDEALDLVGQLGALEELAELRCRRADRLLRAGDLAAAGADYQRATELARRAGMPATLALAHRGLGEIARRRGDWPRPAACTRPRWVCALPIGRTPGRGHRCSPRWAGLPRPRATPARPGPGITRRSPSRLAPGACQTSPTRPRALPGPCWGRATANRPRCCWAWAWDCGAPPWPGIPTSHASLAGREI